MKIPKVNISSQFKHQFDLLSTNTPEYEVTVPWIVENVLGHLPQQTHFIDIGAGRGNLAKPLSEHFDRTTVIEPNTLYHDELMEWAKQTGRTFEGKNTDWLSADMEGNKADFILMSHIMYYVAKPDWMRFIRKAYEILNPNGAIVIVLNTLDNGVADMYKQFLPPSEWQEIAAAESMYKTLVNDGFAYSNVDFMYFESNIFADTLEDTYNLMEFLLLHRVKFEDPQSHNKRKEYAESNLWDGKRFAIRSDAGLITIQKRSKLYKSQFDLLSFHTTEYDHMREYFRSEIFSRLPEKGHFLDIGAGRGNYARPFSQEFTQTTIIEPNDIYFQEILDWAIEGGIHISGHNAGWLEVDFEHTVDLILMSHMLYYVPESDRLAFIQKAYEHLKPGGYLVIVLNSEGCGIRKVYKEFYPSELYDAMPYGEQIAGMLRDNGYSNVMQEVFPAEITVPTYNDMCQLIDFLLLRKVTFETEEIIQRRNVFIATNLVQGKQFIIDSEGTRVIVHKPM